MTAVKKVLIVIVTLYLSLSFYYPLLFLSDIVLSDLFQKKPTDKELRDFLSENIEDLEEVIKLCQNHLSIYRIEEDKEEISYDGIPGPGTYDYRAAERVHQILVDLDINLIECYRDRNHEKTPLYVVTFVVYSVGLAVSGESKALEYYTEWASLQPRNVNYIHRAIKEGKVKPLLRKGWYIYEDSS